jgi:hypothetical protein
MGRAVSTILDPFTGASSTRRAAEQAAEQQAAAGRQAANIAAFRPVGMTSRFGTSRFGVTDVGGVPRVTSAEYEVAPELRAIQDRLMGLTGGALTTAEQAQAAAQPLGQAALGLFGLGQQYLAQSPEELRQRYFNQQQALLAQPRAAEEARLASGVFGRGRAGLNIGTTGQPELAALAGARRQQDLALAAQAEQGAQQQLGFGSSLFGTGASLLGQQYAIPTQALAPLSSLLGTVGTVEQLGQQPFNLGLAVGGAAQPGAQAGAGLLGAGLSQAAQTRYQGVQQANAANAAFLQSLIGAASGGMGGGGGPSPLTFGTPGGGGGFGTGRFYGNQDFGQFF